MSATICPQCGTDNLDVAWQCKSCGASLSRPVEKLEPSLSRKSLVTIAIGVVLLIITFVAFNAFFNATAPSEAEILNLVASGNRSGVNDLIQRSEQAQNLRVLFYVVAGLEIIITGILAYQWRKTTTQEKRS